MSDDPLTEWDRIMHALERADDETIERAREGEPLVSARWMPCSWCGLTDVLVIPEHDGEVLCYECIVDGVRYD